MTKSLRIALIHVMQETDTFNPVPTTLFDFQKVALIEGDSALARVDANGPLAGYLKALEESNVEVHTVPILRADAQSGGRLSRDTLDGLTDRISRQLKAILPVDALMVFLHGAACADGVDDVEGHILSAIRAVSGPDLPLALMLDHHANITQEMMLNSDLVMAFRTQPHDPFETAHDLTQIMIRFLKREILPTMAWRKIPMITHQEQFLTARGPMKEWFDHARQIELAGKALTVSLFPMQPWLDVEEAGWAVVAVTDNDLSGAGRIADELVAQAWRMRDRFMIQESITTIEAIAFADDSSKGTVLLSDTGDSVLGGSTGDSTVILRALIESPPRHRALVSVTDPVAARYLADCDVGKNVTIDIGGWANEFYSPLRVTGTLRISGKGAVQLAGLPQGSIDMGRSSILDIGNVTVLITENSGVGGIHPDVYRHLGVEPADYKMIVMKTASNFQYMKDISTIFVRVATPGPTQSDVHSLPWARIPRPMFPLDEMKDWKI